MASRECCFPSVGSRTDYGRRGWFWQDFLYPLCPARPASLSFAVAATDCKVQGQRLMKTSGSVWLFRHLPGWRSSSRGRLLEGRGGLGRGGKGGWGDNLENTLQGRERTKWNSQPRVLESLLCVIWATRKPLTWVSLEIAVRLCSSEPLG